MQTASKQYTKYKFPASMAIWCALLVTYSCRDDSSFFQSLNTDNIDAKLGEGQIVISFENTMFADTIPRTITFSIYNKPGDVILENQRMELKEANKSTFTSLPVTLKSGYFFLKNCKVYDIENNLLYLDSLISNTIDFKIENGKVVKLEPLLKPFGTIADSLFVSSYYFDTYHNKYISTSAWITLSYNGSTFYSANLNTGVNSIKIPPKINYIVINVIKPLFVAFYDSISVTDLSLYKRVYPYSAFLAK